MADIGFAVNGFPISGCFSFYDVCPGLKGKGSRAGKGAAAFTLLFYTFKGERQVNN
ncbi:MAG: hypothetical protein GTO45_37870 [Candidatus Aminicenantes bacterium]|nr:hypothetical protein [Candidatus Aminicenantes bacterium]NIN23913.1 hypothetical protein [Candidatus Aminicenantes bacterium]NIN47628.1 hypothetical protein [Candidatus Aminicenantes bacterium]NIN90558.1 hypothetical protein [Candidatus Aminicenantes bacterium]NIO87210.1 hypothetical protein [Candidatus Aminicenantes bacterium]